MEIIDKLKEKGWHFTKEGLELISQNVNPNDVHALTKKALEFDLRDISSGSLPTDVAKSKHDYIDGNVVMQILKLKNVAAPKINQESKRFPRLLKLTLTDGKVSMPALEFEHINGLSIDTPPGTKIYLKNCPIKITHNYLLLEPTNASVLGGTVSSLVEKWELERNLTKYAKGSRSAKGFSEIGCPPPWVPFGKHSLEKQGSAEEAALKSIQKFMDEKSQKATAEFEALRKVNIEQALKDDQGRAKKSFGGGKKKLVDANVQKIMDSGFTQAEAENALKYTKHNVDRALKNLQFRADNNPVNTKSERFDKRRGKKDVEETKPSGKISLSDFLEDKLPKQPVKIENYADKNVESASQYRNTVHTSVQNTRPNYGQNPKYNQNGSGKYTPKSGNDFNERNNTGYNRNGENKRFEERPYKKDYNNGRTDPRPYNTPRNVNNIDYRTERLQNQRSFPGFPPSNDMQDLVNKTSTMSISNENNGYAKHNPNNKRNSDNALGEFGNMNKPPAFKSRSNNIKGFQNKQSNENAKDMINTAMFSGRKGPDNQENWKWRIGDRCLAKYWEDKKYYNAEVTGISDNTCVVRFLEYGNYEEITKSDCLPITEEKFNYPPVRQEQTRRAPVQSNIPNTNNDMKRPPPPFSKKREENSAANYRNKPTRNAQSIYVPPAQRN